MPSKELITVQILWWNSPPWRTRYTQVLRMTWDSLLMKNFFVLSEAQSTINNNMPPASVGIHLQDL